MNRIRAFLLVVIALALAACAAPPPVSPSPTAVDPPTRSSSAAAPPPASGDVRTETVRFDGGGSGYLALPKDDASGAKRPAILVIQEWWGLNDWIKEDTRRFARQGYVALAVDLYRGQVATDMDTAHQLSRGLPEDRALGDIKAGFDWLAARSDVDPAHIGIIGFCMGGGYALAFATVEPRLRAAVVNYGRLVTSPEKIGAIHAAVLGNFGADDKGIPAADVRAFAAALKSAGKDADIEVFDGAGHAFMNPNNAHGYNEAATKTAWQRIDAFFARTLH